MPKTNSLEGYLSISEAVKRCNKYCVKVPIGSLKWRIDHGKFKYVRDPYDKRKRRLIPIGEIPNIFGYYTELSDVRNGKYCPLSKLAKEIGLKERSLHGRANKLGIETFRIGNYRVMTKREYFKWKLILNREKEKEKNYVSTLDVGKQFGFSHNRIVYWIKKGVIPAIKTNHKYQISKKDFEEHRDEWEKQCNCINFKRESISDY